MRMLRRGLINGYIKCPEHTLDGKIHLHILFRGAYISQLLLSRWWAQIHNSPVVDIRAIRPRGTKSRIANYMAKYMAKELSGRYSWSWGWVWRGFASHWTLYKRWWWSWLNRDVGVDFSHCLIGWRFWLKGLISLDLEYMRFDYPPDVVITWVIDNPFVKNYRYSIERCG